MHLYRDLCCRKQLNINLLCNGVSAHSRDNGQFSYIFANSSAVRLLNLPRILVWHRRHRFASHVLRRGAQLVRLSDDDEHITGG